MPFVKGKSGNPLGAPRKPEIELIRQAMAEVAIKKKKTLWQHLVEQAYVDNNVLNALAKKFVPDLTKDEGMQNIIRTILVRATPEEMKKYEEEKGIK